MSIAIQGSKSLLYVKENIPGKEGTGDTMQHLSVQEAVGQRGAADVVIHGSTTVSTGNSIGATSVKRLINCVGHGAKRGWIMRPSTGNSAGEEISIVKVLDSDNFVIAYEADLAIGDTFDLCKLITPNYTSTGDLNVVVNSSGSIQFKRNGVNTNVAEDTANPSNNTELPVKIIKNMSDKVFFDYSGVSNAGYTQLIASTSFASKSFTWFESSGEPMVVALGVPGSEVDYFYVPPGGFNGEIPIPIPAGSRVSIKQLSANALSSGIMLVANILR